MNKKNIKALGLSVLGLGIFGAGICMLGNNRKTVDNVLLAGESMTDVVKEIQVYCRDFSKAGYVLEEIQKQLRGNPDYIECNIVVNNDVIIESGKAIGSLITCTVYDGCISDQNINIKEF